MSVPQLEIKFENGSTEYIDKTTAIDKIQRFTNFVMKKNYIYWYKVMLIFYLQIVIIMIYL